MINLFIIAIAFAYSFSSDAENSNAPGTSTGVHPDSYLTNHQFKGRVREIEETCYNVKITNEDTILNFEFGRNLMIRYGRGSTILEFDKSGNLSITKWYCDQEDSLTTAYFYDDQRLTKKTTAGILGWEEYRYTYDKEGRLTAESWDDGLQRLEYTYDGVKKTMFFWVSKYQGQSKPDLVQKEVWTTDSLKRSQTHIKVVPVEQQNGELEYIQSDSIIYNYNEDWQENKLEIYRGSKSILLRKKEYNEFGYVVREISTEGTETMVLDFEYEYDENQNWIKRTIYEGDIPLHVTTRKIEYY